MKGTTAGIMKKTMTQDEFKKHVEAANQRNRKSGEVEEIWWNVLHKGETAKIAYHWEKGGEFPPPHGDSTLQNALNGKDKRLFSAPDTMGGQLRFPHPPKVREVLEERYRVGVIENDDSVTGISSIFSFMKLR